LLLRWIKGDEQNTYLMTLSFLFAAMATNRDAVSLLLRYMGVPVQTIIPVHLFFLVFPGSEIKLLLLGVIRFLVKDNHRVIIEVVVSGWLISSLAGIKCIAISCIILIVSNYREQRSLQ